MLLCATNENLLQVPEDAVLLIYEKVKNQQDLILGSS